MFKAAALKEFREILGIALLALAAYGSAGGRHRWIRTPR